MSRIDDRPVSPVYPPFYLTRHTYITYVHTLRTMRLFTASVGERKSSFPTHQYRLHRYLATLVFPARNKSPSGSCPLLLYLSSSPPRYPALHGNYTKRPTRDDVDVKREIVRVPRVRRACRYSKIVPPFSMCSQLKLSNAICHRPDRIPFVLARKGEDV